MHLAILTRQIGHYHDARYRGAAAILPRVTVISTANQGGFAEFLAQNTSGYEVVRVFNGRADYELGVGQGRLGPAIEAALDGILPDAVAVSGWTNPESVAAIRWGRRNGVPLIMMSESQRDDASRSLLRETIKSRIVSLCDSALVGGPPQASYIERLGIPAGRIHLGYNAVDNDYFTTGAEAARAEAASARARYDLPDRYVLASARFIEKKNLPALVTAYARAAERTLGQTPDLVILGAGDTKSEILKAAHAGGVSDRVRLPGFRGYDVLPAYYGLAEAFAHVSSIEQWGLVVNEAMAAGVPVIVSKPCGVARTVLVEGISGFLVDPNPESIADSLTRLFCMSAEDRALMGQAAAHAIADWGPDRFGSGMTAAVESAVAAPRRGRLAPWDAAILAHMEKAVTERVA